jgi:hypothetical protein
MYVLSLHDPDERAIHEVLLPACHDALPFLQTGENSDARTGEFTEADGSKPRQSLFRSAIADENRGSIGIRR